MPRLGYHVALAMGLLLVPPLLRAQSVSGVVTEADSVTPVSGAIVVALLENGTTAARGLTSTRGTFMLRLSSTETVALKVLRIGFRPTTGPRLTPAVGTTQTVRIIFAGQPVALTAIGVRERETCRVQSDSGMMVANVWEEARKAMLTSQLASEDAPLFAEWIEYDRTLDSTSRIIRRQNIRTARHPTTHAFRSIPADSLARGGYVAQNSAETAYYAPDADVLLSDSFVSTHCFQLTSPSHAQDQGLVGVSFVPTRERRDMKEIEGTLWLARNSSELRYLEFRYLNLPDATVPAHPGGRVEFVRLSDGNWIVSKWNVVMPVLSVRPLTSEAGQRRIVMASSRLILRGVQVRGGEVVRALRRDTLMYQGVGASISLRIMSRDTLVSARGAIVELEGTDYTAAANTDGRVELNPVLAGRYIARIRTPLMDSLHAPEIVHEVEARLNPALESVMLPTGSDVLEHACPRDSIRIGEGMLHGRVRNERAQSMAFAAVTVSWKGDFAIVGAGDGSHVSYSQKTLAALSNAAGYWRVCGVPRSMPLSVAVASDSGSDQRTVRLMDEPFASADLVVRLRAQAMREIDVATNAGARPRALVEVSVVDTRGMQLPDVQLDLMPAGGGARALTTGAGGRALAADILPGVITVRARRIGYMEGIVSVSALAGRNTVPIILSATSIPTLDTMRVVGDKLIKGRHGEFEARRLLGQASTTITRQQIVDRNPTEAWQMLANVNGITLADGFTGNRAGDNAVAARSTRSYSGDFGGQPCFMMIVVDGVVRRPPPGQMSYDLRQLPRPEEIHGVEVFNGPATIPSQYSGTGTGKVCGMIAIWTR